MRPVIARTLGALMAALLLLSIAGTVAYADDPPRPGTTVPADPGYDGTP
jgi:hypothetical protein